MKKAGIKCIFFVSMRSDKTVEIITFQKRAIITKLKKEGSIRVPPGFIPNSGTGSTFSPDFLFGYTWIKSKMKNTIESYSHDSFPYWGIHVPSAFATKSMISEVKEVFCEPGRKILRLKVPASLCFFSSFDLFDGYVLRKRFLGTDTETKEFYRDLISKFPNIDPESNSLYDLLSNKKKTQLIKSLDGVELGFDKTKFEEIIGKGDFIQVTIPEIKKEYILDID